MISSRHFQELIAYAKLWGLPDSTRETARICSTLANAMAPKKQGSWSERDFMPGEYRGKLMKGEDAAKSLRNLARAYSG